MYDGLDLQFKNMKTTIIKVSLTNTFLDIDLEILRIIVDLVYCLPF